LYAIWPINVQNIKKQMLCYEGGVQVLHFAKRPPYVKVDPRRNIGHNTVSKFMVNLMTLTGVPNPIKGRAGNNGIQRDAIGNLVRNGCGEAIRKVAATHESANIQAVYTDITQEMIDGKSGAQMLDSVI
jgi:hypothetical protein